MKRLWLLFCFVAAATTANATTNVSGTISKDSTWTRLASPYVVVGNLTIATGKTLTVDSGVVVRFQSNTGMYVNGSLQAQFARFTSSKDTTGGNPQRGDWNYIQIGDGYTYSGQATLTSCEVRYGGTSSSSNNGEVYLYSGSATLTSCDISLSKSSGLYLGGGSRSASLVLSNTNIFSCEWPMTYGGPCAVTLSGVNNLSGNVHNGIDFRYTEHTQAMTLPLAPVPYVFPYNHFYVRHDGRLTIASKNIIKLGSSISLYIKGGLDAQAASGEQILFTSYTDDNSGGDTNADATATTPAPSYWGGIIFENTSYDSLCVLRRVKVQFGGYYNVGGITMTNASPTIDSCIMVNNFYGAMMQAVSNPNFTNNVIGSSVVVPIAMSFAATPVMANNQFSFSDNRYDAIGLLGGNLPADAVLPIRSVTSIPNVTYLLLEDVTVPAGRTLKINKGIVIKGLYDYPYVTVRPRIIVQGKLLADATADSMIVFTSGRDDNYGNPDDTNKDGTTTAPQREDWGGITFEGGSDTASVLRYCRIKYGVQPNVYYNTRYISGGAITLVNASPTIANCVIENVQYGIYAFQSSNPKILNDTIRTTQYTPIALSVTAQPVFSGDVFVNTAWTALGLIGENLGFSGTVSKRNVAGITNITYILLDDLTINSGTYVTVDPGVVIKCNNSGIFVNGGLRAKGTKNQLIVFTSLKDDNYGNPWDSNGDGDAAPPARGDWKTIRFQGTSDDAFCVLDSCIIKFGGSGNDAWGDVSFSDASGKLTNSTISDSYQYGVSCDGASLPLVQNVAIASCRYEPIAMSLKADPVFSNVSFAANRSNGIKILEGTLSSNATLRQRDVAGFNNIAYIVDYLTISSNALLTIEPGVVIKFPVGWYHRSITVDGGLVANGTATQKIVFTSLSDDSNGGDTNNDGSTSSPAKGDWFSITFTETSMDTLNKLRNCDIRYGGTPPYNDYSYKSWGMLRLLSSRVLIDSCTFQHSSTSGIGIYGSSDPSITHSQITNIAETPITMSLFSNPTFSNNLSLNVGYLALGIVPEIYSVTATVPKRDFAGYSNITYVLYSNGSNYIQTVNSGTIITIPEGVVFKGGEGWVVNGGLLVNGTAAQPVVFTDKRDDSAGNPGDTNGDGTATKPAVQDNASCLTFTDVSVDASCSLRYVSLRYKDWGVKLQQASPVINHCTFDHDRWGIQLNGVSTPAVDSCLFSNLIHAPLHLSLVSYPRSTLANVLAGSTYRALGVVEEVLSQDVVLVKREFAGIKRIPYFFHNYTIGSSAILTIQPGVILKFYEGDYLDVHKGLIAEGGQTPDSTIVFTDYRDDFYGGDMNADSTYTEPQYNYKWRGIVFQDESLDPLCRLSHCVVQHTGVWWTTDEGGITTISASPTISQSILTMHKTAIYAKSASNPVVQYCDIFDNEYGINNVNKAFTIDARWNWWGNNSGPTHTSNTNGTGNKVSDNILFTPYLGSGTANPMPGDVSLNGSIQAHDASLILKYVVNPLGADSLSALQRRVANVSGDILGITSYDASLILQYVVGIIETFPMNLKNLPEGGASLLKRFALQKEAQATLALKPVPAKRGERITIPVTIENVSHLYALEAILSYDPALLTIEAVEFRGPASASWTSYVGNSEIRFAVASGTVLEQSGTVAEITAVVSNEVRGNVQTEIQPLRVLANEKDITAMAKSGAISIAGKPVHYGLSQNYPNPFNPATTIGYQLPNDNTAVRLTVYNLLGQAVRTLVSTRQDAGTYTIVWDGKNDNGVSVTSGVYLYQLQAGDFMQSRKLMLLK